MGTPDFSVPCLQSLVTAGHELPLVVTQPDRPRGRGLKLEPPPVKRAALDLGLPVYQPDRVNRPEHVARIAELEPDVLVVVAYGAILKETLLTLAPHGAVNVHASLLPRHRGMSPIQRAIWDGDAETGVTTMHMDAGVDTGDIILMERTPIGPDETGGELHDRLSVLGARVLVDTLARLADGTAPRRKQEGEATYAARLDKKDGAVDWTLPARDVHNHARALTPWPGAGTWFEAGPVGVLKTRMCDGPQSGAAPGTIVDISEDSVSVACGAGDIRLVEVRPAGRKTMSAGDFARGRRLAAGVRFDAPPEGSR